MNYYNVSYKNAIIGKANVEIRGLYAHIRVSCKMLQDDFFRLLLKCKGCCTDLGVLLPEKNAIGICTKIPAKYIDFETLTFEIISKSQIGQSRRIAIDPNAPFYYLDRVTALRVVHESGDTNLYLQLVTE